MDKEYSFSVELAIKYGVNAAIMLKNLMFWIEKNMANKKHFYDGKYWTYNSVRAFQLLFPFWTDKQIRRILDNLVEKKVIAKGNYNKIGYDRTLWYTIIDEAIKGKCICPNGQMEMTKRANRNDQTGEPIPYINTDNKTDEFPIHVLLCMEYAKIHFEKLCINPLIKEEHYLSAKKVLDTANNEKEREELFKQIVKIIPDYFTKPFWFNSENKEGKIIRKSSLSIGVFLAHCLEILADSKPVKKEVKKKTCSVCGQEYDHSCQPGKCKECIDKEVEQERGTFKIPDFDKFRRKLK